MHQYFGFERSHYGYKKNKSRVPDQNGVSQARYIVEIHHSGQEREAGLATVGGETLKQS